MNPLNVLFVTQWYPTARNPVAGVFVREHARAAGLRHNVTVLHLAGTDPRSLSPWRIEQETNQTLTAGIPTYRAWHLNSPIPKTWYALYLSGALRAYREIVTQHGRPDILHAHVYRAGVPAILIGKLNDLPTVITEHSSAFLRRSLTALQIMEARLALQSTALVLPVSQALQSSIESYGVQARFQVVPNVVDTALFAPPEQPSGRDSDSKRLVSVGLMDPTHKKGLPFLFEALATMALQRDDWTLDLVGDGPARSEYEATVRELKLAGKVTFHGLKSKQDVASLVHQADVYVLPSLFETFSVTTAEALACGIPVVATRCGGPEEFVADGMGILVPPADSQALGRAISAVIDNLDAFDSERISRVARERFSPAAVGEQLHQIYSSLCPTAS